MNIKRKITFHDDGVDVVSGEVIETHIDKDSENVIRTVIYQIKNKEATLKRYDGFHEKVFTIPTRVLHFKITTIGKHAFQSVLCDLTKVILPKSIVTIEPGAFTDCDTLKEAIVPSSITEEMCQKAFMQTTRIRKQEQGVHTSSVGIIGMKVSSF